MINKDRRPNVVSLTNRRAPRGCGARQNPDSSPGRYEISDEVLEELRQDVLTRRVKRGVRWLEEHRDILTALNPHHQNTASCIGYLSQWVEVSDCAADTVRELLHLFPSSSRGRISLEGYLHLRLAEGILQLADGETESAAAHFDLVISLQHEPIEQELAALAHFWRGRCALENREWDGALASAERARSLMLAIGHIPAAAMMRALEGCLNVHKGRPASAMELLQEAEAELQQAGDSFWLANIQSAYGSIAIDEGRYESAVGHFTRAVVYHRECSAQLPDIARSLTRLAQAQRLTALQIAGAIDKRLERRRKSKTDSPALTEADAREDVERLRGEAFRHLAEAIATSRSLVRLRCLALALIERGFLSADCGHFDRAACEANEAFELGSKIKDRAVMAQASLLHSRIENAQYEEGIGENPARHAQRAHDFAQEALNYARQTGDRRLLASAYLCQAQAFCNEFFNDTEAAAECCRQAAEFLTPDNRSQLWQEHQALIRKVARTGHVDTRFQEWSQGLVGGKTFQQMTEDFADLVIPTVWEREGRNISRVVAKLSISPKKVRRILSRAGLKGAND